MIPNFLQFFGQDKNADFIFQRQSQDNARTLLNLSGRNEYFIRFPAAADSHNLSHLKILQNAFSEQSNDDVFNFAKNLATLKAARQLTSALATQLSQAAISTLLEKPTCPVTARLNEALIAILDPQDSQRHMLALLRAAPEHPECRIPYLFLKNDGGLRENAENFLKQMISPEREGQLVSELASVQRPEEEVIAPENLVKGQVKLPTLMRMALLPLLLNILSNPELPSAVVAANVKQLLSDNAAKANFFACLGSDSNASANFFELGNLVFGETHSKEACKDDPNKKPDRIASLKLAKEFFEQVTDETPDPQAGEQSLRDNAQNRIMAIDAALKEALSAEAGPATSKGKAPRQ